MSQWQVFIYRYLKVIEDIGCSDIVVRNAVQLKKMNHKSKVLEVSCQLELLVYFSCQSSNMKLYWYCIVVG